jgi:hypothetical protein
MRRFVVFALLAAGLFLVACNSGKPSITLEATNLDLGIVVNGDLVSRDLTVRNDGDADLVIDSIITSCTCTQASVNPMTIAPNQSGVLHIEFDSGFHGPDLTGPLIRQVFINSNDPQRPEFKVELRVIVDANTS